MLKFIRNLFLIGFWAFFSNSVFAQNCTVNAGVATTICPGAPFTLTGSASGLFASGGTAVWSQTTGPAVTVSATTISGSIATANVTGYSTGNNYGFRLTGKCTDGSLVYQDVIYTTSTATVANAGVNMSVCPGTINLAANTLQNGEIGTWTVISGGLPLPNNANSPTSSVTIPTGSNPQGAGVGATTYRWTIISGSCTSHSDVVITNQGGVSPVSAGTTQNLSCYTTTASTQLNASYAGNGTLGQIGTWSFVTGPSTPSFNNIHVNNTTVSNLIQGTYVLRWTVNGSCVSGSSDVTINVAAASQNVTIASNANLTYCDGRSSTVLSAQAPLYTNETVTWSQTAAQASAGVNIESPNSPTTTISGLNGTTQRTFIYTITNSMTGCSSSGTYYINYTSAPSLTVNSGNPNIILACNASTVTIPLTVSGGNTTQWSLVSGPSGSVLGGPSGTTAYTGSSSTSQTITGLTVIGTYVIRFKRSSNNSSGGCNDAFQDVSVFVSQNVTAANAGTKQVLACNVFSTNLQGNTPSIGSGSWTQVSGPNTANIIAASTPNTAINGLAAGTYVFRWIISGGNGNCGNTQSDVSVVVSSPSPTTSAAGSNVAACYATPIKLTGNQPASNETGTWSVSPSAGVAFNNTHDPNAVVTGLSNNTIYTFTWTISNACGTSSSNVTITTSATAGPNQANAGVDQCRASGSTSFTLAGNATSAGETGVWTLLAGAPNTPTYSNAYNTAVTGTINGSYTFEWSLAKGGCAVSRDTVLITISAPATASNAGSNINQCGFSAITLNGNNPAIGHGAWSQTGGPGGAVITNPSLYNSTVSGLQVGQYIFQWTISNGACSSNSSTVTVNVSTPPTTANAGADISLCGAASSATLGANTITTGTGLWSVRSGPNNPTFSNSSSPTSTVSGLVTGTYVLRWTSSYGPYCPASTSDVNIFVTQAASAGTNQNLCSQTSTVLSGNEGSSGTWTQVGSTPTVATITANSSNTAIASNMTTGGVYTFMYSLPAIGFCAATSSTMTVNVVPAASQAMAGDDVNACQPNATPISVTLGTNSSTPTSGTGTWTVQSKFPVSLPTPTFGNVNNVNTTLNGLTAGPTNTGLYILQWQVSNGAPCASGSSDIVRVTIYSAPSTAVAGANQNAACSSQITMNATAPAVGIGTWTQTAGTVLPAGSIDAPNSATTAILNTTTGNSYTFRWTVSNGSCSPSTSDVNISVVAATPSTANAGTPQTLCNQNSTILGATAVQPGETGTWTVIAQPNGSPNPVFVNVNDPGTIISNLQQGNYSLQWTVSNAGTCTTSAMVNISVSNPPTTSIAGPDASYCLYSPVVLAATPVTSGTGNWNVITKPTGSPTPVFSSVIDPGATVNGLVMGAYTFQWTTTNGTCPSSSSQVNITISTCQIGATKAANTPALQSNGSYNLSFSFGLTNTGTASLSGVQATDDLQAAFPGASFTVTSINAGGTLIANPTFNGTTDKNLLTAASSSLAASATAAITINLNMTVPTFGTYLNTATASGNAPGGVTVSDISNDGTVLNQPSGIQTPINFPMIGIGKIVSAPAIQTNGTYNIDYTLTVQNFGKQNLQNIQVSDILNNIFSNPITYTLRSAPTVSGGTGLTINPSFDGSSVNQNLLTAASSSLAVGATRTITIPLNVMLSGNFGTYTNTATGTASTSDGTPVSDISNNSANPDGNRDGNPFNDSAPTPVTFNSPDVQVTKTVNNSTPTAGTNVVFTIVANNNGPGDASGVTVTDLLNAGYTYVSSVPSVGTYNPATGLWSIGIITNGSSKTLTITATVNHTKSSSAYQNTATSSTPFDNNASNNTQTISVNPVQTPPQPANDSKNGVLPGATATLNILANDKLSDGSSATTALSTLDIDPSTPGVQTSLVVNGQGTWTYDSSTGIINFVPIAGYTVSPTPITYTLTELATGLSANATVTVTYTPAPPIPANDMQSGFLPGATATLNILSNDKLSDGSQATIQLTKVDLDPNTAGIQTTLTVSGQGTYTYDPTSGNLTFVPIPGYTISPAPIPYRLIENLTGLSASATVNLTYTPEPPVPVNDSKSGILPGAPAILNILSNDKLSDGSPATVSLTSVDLDPNTPGTQTTFTVAGQGTWTYDQASGNLTFTPIPGYTISPSPITYTLTELATGLSANATVTVTYTPTPPIPANDNQSGFLPGATATLNILSNDKLSDGSQATIQLTKVDLDPNTAGIQTTLTVSGQGTYTYDPTSGNLTFVPIPGYTISPAQIPYRLIENLTGLSASATVNLTYTPEPPVPVNDSKSGILPGAPATLNILSNDKLSDGSQATVSLTSVDLDPNTPGTQTTFTVAGQGTWTYDQASGNITFTPIPGYTISPSPITYTLIENSTSLGATATVTVTYTPTPPIPANDMQSGFLPGATATLNILSNDKLSDGSQATIQLTKVDLDPNTAGIQTTLTVSGQGTYTYDPTSGNLTFVPIPGYTISPAPIPYRLIENLTGLSASATVNLTYTPEPPVPVNDSKSGILPGAPATLNILSNDKLSDGSQATTALSTLDIDPSSPGIQTSFVVSGQGTWTYDQASGNLTFTPIPGYTISPTPLTYALIENATSLSANAIVTLTYTLEPPIPANDNKNGILPGATATLNIQSNDKLSDGSPATSVLSTIDIDPSTPGVQTSLVVSGQGTWTYNASTGIITFTPIPGYTISPTAIPYTLTENATSLSANSIVTLTYAQRPPAPVNDNQSGFLPGANATLNILANDKLSDGSQATTALTSVDLDPNTAGTQSALIVAGQGTWTYDQASGKITFTPIPGYSISPAPIPYALIENSTGLSANATITLTYTLEPPVPVNDSKSGILPGAPATLNILSNDKLSDGSQATSTNSTLDIDPSTPGIQTSLVVPGQGTWTYDQTTGNTMFTPVPGYTISPSPIPYTLTELITGLSANAIVNLNYTTLPPIPAPDVLSGLSPGMSATLNILSNDKLSDGSPATTSLTTVDLDPNTAGIQVSLVVAGQGTWNYDPNLGKLSFSPVPGFTISPSPISYLLIENATGLSASTTATLTYLIIPPVAANDLITGVLPGTSPSINILSNDKLSDGSPAIPSLTSVDLDPNTPGNQSTLIVAGQGEWKYDASNGNLQFIPDAGYTVSPSSIPYTLIENATGLNSIAFVTVSYIGAVPHPMDDLSKGNRPDSKAVINILANDKLSDGSPATTILTTVDLDPLTPGVQTTLNVAGQGAWSYDPSSGNLVFTPYLGFTISPTPIPYTLTEIATGLSAGAMVTVLYVPLPPIAVNDLGSGTVPGAQTVLNILSNDKLSDGSPALPAAVTVDLDPSTVGVQTTLNVANEGTWIYDPASGNVTFTPLPGYISDPTPISYTLTEILTGLSSNASITLKSAVDLQIGLAKTVNAPHLELNGSYTMTYQITVKDYGNVPLTNIAVFDNLRGTFPAPMDIAIKSVTATGTLMANNNYTGTGTESNNLLLPASTLASGQEETISLTINVLANGKSGVFMNSAIGTASSQVGGQTSDVSTDGINPDPNGNNNPSDTGEDKPTQVVLALNDVIIPEGFSPNGDGINDRFIIENAGNSTIDLTIFNRWGNIVYKSAEYKNDWDGTCNVGLHIGQNVPDGTYYYIAIINGMSRKVRFITIHR